MIEFEETLIGDLEEGRFELPESYGEMLNLLVLMVNMCFETHTFKNLINGKMMFFRDNNKTKN